MNHHEAQVIAAAYQAEGLEIQCGQCRRPDARTMPNHDRAMLLRDHSAVWQRVADNLKETPNATP